MICYARYLLQTYPSSSVPFFKQMYVLLVTNLCSSVQTLGFFFCLLGGAGQMGKNCKQFGKEAKKKRENAMRSTSVKFVFLAKNYDYIFQNSLLEYQKYAPPARPAAAKCSLRSVSFRCCCKTASVCSLLILCCCCLLVVVVVNRDGPTPRCCCCCCC